MARKTVLITGGSGFVGRNLAEVLPDRFDILRPTHAELPLENADAVDAFLRDHDVDVVVHAANIGGNRKDRPPTNSLERNLRMFFNLVRRADRFDRLIQLGSGAEYGRQRPLVRVREDEFGAVVPADEYGLYKYVCSRYIEHAANIVCLRIFGCFGPYEDYEVRFISNAICKSLLGFPITIANRDAVFSYLAVQDLARLVAGFIEHKRPERFYNVVPDQPVSLLEVANMVKGITGNPHPVQVRHPGRGPEYSGDNTRLRAALPGFRFTSMQDAVGGLHRWYEERRDGLDPERLRRDRF